MEEDVCAQFFSCGHGGERWICNNPVDGFHLPSTTVFQFHGCFFHGCPTCYPNHEQLLGNGKKAKDLFETTTNRTAPMRQAGFTVVEKQSCEHVRNPPFTKTFHMRSSTISKQSGTRTNAKNPPKPWPSKTFMFQSLTPSANSRANSNLHLRQGPQELCLKFMEELEKRGKKIR